MSIMQEQKMIDESLLLRYFEKEVSEEEKKKSRGMDTQFRDQ